MQIPAGWEGLSDEELALRARQEPRIAFEVLFDRHRNAVYGYLSRMIPDRDRVDDLFQTVFLRVFRALPAFKLESRFKTWVFAIASNAATDEIRSRGRRGAPVELRETMAVADEAGGERMDAEIEIGRVKGAVAALPDGWRQLFTLVRFQGMKIAEAAQVLGMAPTAAKVMLFRAQRRVGEIVTGQPVRDRS